MVTSQWKLVLSLLLMPFCVGCIFLPVPYKGYDHLSMRGRVIDASTETPIKGAQLSWILGSTASSSEDIVQENGEFEIRSPKSWRFGYVLWPLLPLDFPYTCHLKIESSPYRTVYVTSTPFVHFGWLWNLRLREKMVDIGTIVLQDGPDATPAVYYLGDVLESPRLIEYNAKQRDDFLDFRERMRMRGRETEHNLKN